MRHFKPSFQSDSTPRNKRRLSFLSLSGRNESLFSVFLLGLIIVRFGCKENIHSVHQAVIACICVITSHLFSPFCVSRRPPVFPAAVCNSAASPFSWPHSPLRSRSEQDPSLPSRSLHIPLLYLPFLKSSGLFSSDDSRIAVLLSNKTDFIVCRAEIIKVSHLFHFIPLPC